MSIKESNFKKSQNKRLFSYISRVFIYVTAFLKAPLDDYWQLLNLLWPEPCRIMSLCGSKILDIKGKFSRNLIENFSHNKSRMANCVNTQNFFQRFIKIIGILLLIVRFVKNSNQTIIQITRKNKLIFN